MKIVENRDEDEKLPSSWVNFFLDHPVELEKEIDAAMSDLRRAQDALQKSLSVYKVRLNRALGNEADESVILGAETHLRSEDSSTVHLATNIAKRKSQPQNNNLADKAKKGR